APAAEDVPTTRAAGEAGFVELPGLLRAGRSVAHVPLMRSAGGPRRTRRRRAVSDVVRSALDERAQHVVQDATVAVVLRLTGGVDTHDRVELDDGTIGLLRGHVHGPRRRAVADRADAGDRDRLRAVET